METQKNPSEELLDLLVEEGAVARTVADSVRNRLRDTWIPIGKILRRRGALTTAQLEDLLQLQAATPEMRLGEIALERGYCSAVQLEDALRVQRELSPHVLDLLAETAGVEPEHVLRAITRYVRELETRVSSTRRS